ncbi:MAG: amidohydrolase family protein [Solirubrobacterales bacterium]
MKIDVFAHVVTPRYRERVSELLRARDDGPARGHEGALVSDPTLTDLDARLRFMDEFGDDYRQVLVMGHFSVEQEAPDVARDLARLGNEELADLVAGHPDRFVGWVAQAALQDGERGLEAVEEAIEAGAMGAQVFTTTQGRPLDHPDYEPFFALMARLGRPIWIHPNRMLSDFPLTEPEPRFGLHALVGWPHDTTLAMIRLVYAGYLERWPELKIIAHHGGGTVPMLAGRLKLLEAGPENDEVLARLRHPPLEYLKRFYADTANFGNPIALQAGLEFFGPEQIVFGSDFGFSPDYTPETIEDIETVVVDDDLKEAIYDRNPRRFLGLDETPPAG